MRKKITTLTLAFLAITTLFFVSCDEDSDNAQTIPMVAANRTNIGFGNLEINEESAVEMVEIAAIGLSEDVTIAVPSGFSASLEENANFSTDQITIEQSAFDSGTVFFYVKAVPENNFQGTLSGNLDITSQSALGTVVSLSATVGIQINGDLFMSEYFEQYSTSEWTTTMPLDYGILGWKNNTPDFYADAATLNDAYADLGVTFPTTTVANNQVYNTWYLVVPLNGLSLRGSLGISDASSLSLTGYPSVAGARDIVLDPNDASQSWNWINKNNLKCIAPPETGANTSAGRRFADDDYASDVFMSALVNISALGEVISGKESSGIGDIIALANATSGASNNNTIKVVALADGNGGFNFGLIKENEANPAVLSEASYALNQTYAIVLSHEFVEGDNNDVSKLYVFEEGTSIPTSMENLDPVATIDESYTDGNDPATLNIVYMRERRQNVVNPKANVTGIRVGNTWLATLFEKHENAQNSNDLSLDNRVLVNTGADCTP